MGISIIWLIFIFFFILGFHDTTRSDLDKKAFNTLLETLFPLVYSDNETERRIGGYALTFYR